MFRQAASAVPDDTLFIVTLFIECVCVCLKVRAMIKISTIERHYLINLSHKL